MPGCILVQVTPGHRFQFALQLQESLGLEPYVPGTDTFKNIRYLQLGTDTTFRKKLR